MSDNALKTPLREKYNACENLNGARKRLENGAGASTLKQDIADDHSRLCFRFDY